MIKEFQTPKLKTQVDAFMYFLQRMDLSMLDTLLDDQLTYQDFPKHKFIQLLGGALENFEQAGDSFLQAYSGKCGAKSCNYGLKGFLLVGNLSGNYMNILVKSEQGRITDLFECLQFKCPAMQSITGDQIFIDPDIAPF